ncbi:hypothetical protein NDU88_000724, partial [Pleurodeles waltl]
WTSQVRGCHVNGRISWSPHSTPLIPYINTTDQCVKGDIGKEEMVKWWMLYVAPDELVA